MGLIRVAEHRPEDLRAWEEASRGDLAYARTEAHARQVMEAMRELREFAARGPCYVSTSWGKDSLVVAHMMHVMGLDLPLVWVRLEGRDNPMCPPTRDAFLARFPCDYHEVTVPIEHIGAHGPDWGFAVATERWGRYISGVRAAESRERKIRCRKGLSLPSSCAPLGWWGSVDVWAYLASHDVPITPVYACTFGGRITRDDVRTASIGGERGRRFGRAEWEAWYFANPRPSATCGAIDREIGGGDA